MGAGLNAIGPSTQGPSDRVCLVAGVVEHKVRMSAGAAQPAVDAVAVLFEGEPDGMLGGCPIIPGRRSGDVSLFPKPIAQLLIGLPNMLTQGMTAIFFILSKVPRGADGGGRSGISCNHNGVRHWWLCGVTSQRSQQNHPAYRRGAAETDWFFVADHAVFGVEHNLPDVPGSGN